MTDNLKQIASYSFPYEAQIAKASLRAANIPAFITDEHTINMNWLYSNALGGVRVFVPVEYESEAKQLITQDFSEILNEQFEEEPNELKTCSSCGGTNLEYYTIGKKPAYIVWLLIGFPLFFYKQGVKCNCCGKITAT